MKLEQGRFDTLLGRVNHAKPEPRASKKATGKRGAKTPRLPSKS
jgi:hypothetical protein